MEKRISLWLMPSSEYFELLQDRIRSLAKEYDAQVFEPHVTVWSGLGTEVTCKNLIERAISGVRSMTLQVKKIDFSPEFFKTLFIVLRDDSALSKFSERFRVLWEKPSTYELKPHLSLIYKHMARNEQQRLASGLELPWRQIEFDWIKAMSTPPDDQAARDVTSWRSIFSANLQVEASLPGSTDIPL